MAARLSYIYHSSFYPEHNTDYWLPQELIDYQTCILNIIKDISALDIYDKILIKDHLGS